MILPRRLRTKHTAWSNGRIATGEMGGERIKGTSNGQGGIRTLEGVAPLPVFEANIANAESFVESATRREWSPRSVGPRKEIAATFSRNSNLRLT
jgi:hypothetical protein